MLVMAPRDHSNSEAPGLPVALSKIAGVTNTPVPSFHLLSRNSHRRSGQ